MPVRTFTSPADNPIGNLDHAVCTPNFAVVHDEKMVRNYPNPLVTDALIDLRVTLPPETQVEALWPMVQALSEEFALHDLVVSQTVQFDTQEVDKGPTSTSDNIGYTLYSENPNWSAQLTLEGFTFLHHKPYTNWEDYSSEAKRLWIMYKKALGVAEISRVALRYINRLDIPSSENFSEYLELKPLLPQAFPSNAVHGFLMQLQMPQIDLESMLILNLFRLLDPSPDTIACVLDFELSQEHQWDVREDDAVWELFERFRDRKNELFEASITPKARIMMGDSG